MASNFRIKNELFVDAKAAVEAKDNMCATDVFVTMRKFFKDVSNLVMADAKGLDSLDLYFAEVAAVIWNAGRLYGKKKKQPEDE